jgi:hypothetical protein
MPTSAPYARKRVVTQMVVEHNIFLNPQLERVAYIAENDGARRP